MESSHRFPTVLVLVALYEEPEKPMNALEYLLCTVLCFLSQTHKYDNHNQILAKDCVIIYESNIAS